jgi:hypothetical protein
MRKRTLVALGISVPGAIALLLVFCVYPWPDPAAKYARLHKGMTMDEVDAVTGTPPDSDTGLAGLHHPRCRVWRLPEAEVVASFDEQGRVLCAMVDPLLEEPWLERLGQQPGWRWLGARLGTTRRPGWWRGPFQLGMSTEQADAIMGRPCDDLLPPSVLGVPIKIWNAPEGHVHVMVFLDEQGTVTDAVVHPQLRRSVLDRLRSRLGW